MAKVNKKELVKNIKALNKKKLTDKVDVKGDVEDLQEDFISAIEDIDDNNKIDDVPESVIDFYEGLIEDDEDDDDKGSKKSKGKKGGKKSKAKDEDEDDDDDDEDDDDDDDEDDESSLADELEEMSLKDLKAYVKDNDIEVDGKITKKTRDAVIEQILAAGDADDEDDDDDDDDEDEGVDLSELSLKELKAKAKELGYEGKVTKKTRDDVEEALEELMEKGSDDDDDDDDDDEDDDNGVDVDEMDKDELLELCKEKGFKPKKAVKKNVKKLRKFVAEQLEDDDDDDDDDDEDTKSSKGKGSDREIPKGLRKNTLPSEIYLAIKKGGKKGASMKDLAQIVADAKNKGKKKKEQKAALSFQGFVQRTVARKVAAAEGVSVVQKHANSGNEGDAVFVLE